MTHGDESTNHGQDFNYIIKADFNSIEIEVLSYGHLIFRGPPSELIEFCEQEEPRGRIPGNKMSTNFAREVWAGSPLNPQHQLWADDEVGQYQLIHEDPDLISFYRWCKDHG